MNLRDRIGFDAGATKLEDAVAWAASNGFRFLDFNCDSGPNLLSEWPPARARAVRAACDRAGIHIGLHTLSAVNVAETSPLVSEAVDAYLKANIELAARLGCEWVIVHGGYHFSGDAAARERASVERLKRAVGVAEQSGATLLLENLNKEPEHAEIHYLAHNVEECRRYFGAIRSERFRWAFTANHSHLVPEGIGGFLDEFGASRIGEVRLADNTGEYEVHLNPGQGTIDFRALFRRLEASGYRRHYSMAFGTLQDKLHAREEFSKYG
jgi:sugar phosphate isomerase/epimerase